MAKFNIDPRYSYEPNAVGFEDGPWSCIDDRTYDGAGSNMIGWGKTQEEALEDLERLFEERAEYQQAAHEAECERRGIQGYDTLAERMMDLHDDTMTKLRDWVEGEEQDI